MLETLLPSAPPTLHGRLGDPRLVAEMIADTDALVDGHFKLLGGAHSDRFVRFSRVASDTKRLELVAGWLAPTVAAWLPSAILAPSTAGVALGATLAEELGLPLFLAATDDDGRAARIHAGHELADGRVALVNDVVTTGRGLAALAAAARGCNASVVGAAWFVSRASVDVPSIIGAPAASLAAVELSAWEPEQCPLCVQHEPLTHAFEVN